MKHPITCTDHKPKGTKGGCEHYIKGGTCSLRTRFTCEEWAKSHPVDRATGPSNASSGHLAPDQAEKPSQTPHKLGNGTGARAAEPTYPNPTDFDHITRDMLIARGLTFEIDAGLGILPVRLVPEYDLDGPRNDGEIELSITDAHTLALTLSAFPEAKITSIRPPKARMPKTETDDLPVLD